eukprot:54570_1
MSEKQLIKLLQDDNRGWKTDLFENTNGILHALCARCGSVCKDAVELDCEHDDEVIFLHCADCLQELISKNNGNCPINNHINPIIARSRATRRLISKCIMLCPYSIQYQQRAIQYKNDIQNNQIIVTDNGFDEKEGIQPHINNNSSIKGCNFKGTINNLLKNHISECIQIYNPLYTHKIIVNKYKEQNLILRNKIDYLNKQNQEILQENTILKTQSNTLHKSIMEKENENAILKERNKKLQKNLNLSNEKVIGLEIILKQQKHENNIVNEEKKNDR